MSSDDEPCTLDDFMRDHFSWWFRLRVKLHVKKSLIWYRLTGRR